MLGESVFGGVGAGLYGIFVFVVLAVVIAGFMGGRLPSIWASRRIIRTSRVAMCRPHLTSQFNFRCFGVKPYGTAGIHHPGHHGSIAVLYDICHRREQRSALAGSAAKPCGQQPQRACPAAWSFFMINSGARHCREVAKRKLFPESDGHFP